RSPAPRHLEAGHRSVGVYFPPSACAVGVAHRGVVGRRVWGGGFLVEDKPFVGWQCDGWEVTLLREAVFVFRLSGKHGEPVHHVDVNFHFLTVVNEFHDLDVEDSIWSAVPDGYRSHLRRRAHGLPLSQQLGCDPYKTSLPFEVSLFL